MSASTIAKRFGFILAFCSITGAVWGQQIASGSGKPAPTPPKVAVKKPKPLSRELSGGFRLNTDGWSMFMDKGYVRGGDEPKYQDQFYNLRVVQLELGEHKSAKEIKNGFSDSNPNTGEKSKPFIYGKVNNFYALKAGYGFRKMIAGKPEPGTVSIHWVGIAGLALGMEKPYYLDAYVPEDNFGNYTRQSIKYTDDAKGSFLNENLIIGSSGFAKGLGEIQWVPGVHVKTALHFDFAPNKKNILAVEAGANAELYSRKVMLMANQEAVPYFFNLFASFQFGRRW